MSEAFDMVRHISELPLFPLSVVLYPGTPLPLHIFEDRYRKMFEDIRAGDNLFGLSYFDASISGLDLPPAGHVGCVASVRETQELPDGRSNILAVGLIRYKVDAYEETGDPYLVARVSFFEDENEDQELLAPRAQHVAGLFLRIARAVRTINDELVALPEVPETNPEQLSFLVASAIELDVEVKQELLELRYTSERLKRLRELLSSAVAGYEEKARIHKVAKSNGHNKLKVKID